MKINRRKSIFITLMGLFVLVGQLAWASGNDKVRNIAEWNLNNSLALQGYDPVSYFPEGGSQATLGKVDLKLDYEGVVYYFANMDNLNRFTANPTKYEPAHGIWCSFAMASGQKVDINPNMYEVDGNRLFLFVNAQALNEWKATKNRLLRKADRAWKRISGEDPRN